MPFDPLETEPKHVAAPTALIEYMRPKPRGNKSGDKYDRTKHRPRLAITIPTTICGGSKAEAFRLHLGTGDDAGRARIKGAQLSDAKAVKPHQFLHAMTFKFGFVPSLGDEIADKERVPVRLINRDEFEIDLPAWWKVPAPVKLKAAK
jgi:hypothetical protein